MVDPKLYADSKNLEELRTNVSVSLYDGEGLMATTRADDQGNYKFAALTPKPYTVIYLIADDDPMATQYCFARTDL